MKKTQSLMMTVNVLTVIAIFILNYFYQLNGFDFTLKCICSGAFAFLGVINLCYALRVSRSDSVFYIGMSLGLVLAFLGDVLIGYDFIIGAATFALGHVSFAVAYCFLQKVRLLDGIVSGVLFLGASAFLLFSPLLHFEEPIYRVVCIIYALIISVMLGKAVGNFVRERTLFTGTVALASGLFFFSDLMLVLDWFVGLWSWTDHACMGTYYPALCFLALSMMLRCMESGKKNG